MNPKDETILFYLFEVRHDNNEKIYRYWSKENKEHN